MIGLVHHSRARIRRTIFVGYAVCLMLISSVYVPQQAKAGGPLFGRGINLWYYSGATDTGAWYMFDFSPDINHAGLVQDVILNPFMDEASFIESIRVRLYSPTDHNRARASIVINMMMGYDGTDALFNGPSANRWENGVTLAQANYTTWSNLIKQYNAAGQVNFNAIYSAPNPLDWSGAVLTHTYGGGMTPQDGPDAIYQQLTAPAVNWPVVQFYAANGTTIFTINKQCANLPGNTLPLTTPTVPIVLGCGSASIASVPHVSVGDPLAVRVTLTGSSTGAPNPGTISVTGPAGFSPTTWNNVAFGPYDAVTTSYAAVSPAPAATAGPAGAYTITWSSPSLATPCSSTAYVSIKPYLRANGSDIQVGGSFTSVAGDPSATVLGFVDGGGVGSSAQLAIFAAGAIDQFVSGSGSASAALGPKALTFSNTAGDPTYGGGFGASNTIRDFNQLFTAAGSVVHAGPYTVAGQTVSGQDSILVDGDIYITGSVVYDTSAPWTVNTVPSITVVSRGGNIYIAPGVSTLDGTYVAMPDNAGANGRIYTCAGFDAITSKYRIPTSSEVGTLCGNALTVNGAFVANHLRPLRWKNGVDTAATASDGGAGEVFNFSPEVWLHNTLPATTSGNTHYDAETFLPPVL